MTSGGVTSCEYFGDTTHAVAVNGDVASAVQINADLSQYSALFRVQKPHGQQGQFSLDLKLAAGDLFHGRTPTVDASFPLDPHGVQLLQFAVASGERLGQHGIVSDAALFVGRRQPEDFGPLGPWVIAGSLFRGLVQQLQLVHHLGALPNRRAQAVGASVAAAKDDYPFAFCLYALITRNFLAGQNPVLLRKVVHSQVDSR